MPPRTLSRVDRRLRRAARTSAQDTFTGDKRRTFGGIAGVAATVAPGFTLGVSVDQSSTKVDISNFPQSGRIDLTQVSVKRAYETGNWIFGGALIYGSGRVHSTPLRHDGRDHGRLRRKTVGPARRGELLHQPAEQLAARAEGHRGLDHSANRRLHRNRHRQRGLRRQRRHLDARAITAGAELGHSWLVDRKLFDSRSMGASSTTWCKTWARSRSITHTGAAAPRRSSTACARAIMGPTPALWHR